MEVLRTRQNIQNQNWLQLSNRVSFDLTRNKKLCFLAIQYFSNMRGWRTLNLFIQQLSFCTCYPRLRIQSCYLKFQKITKVLKNTEFNLKRKRTVKYGRVGNKWTYNARRHKSVSEIIHLLANAQIIVWQIQIQHGGQNIKVKYGDHGSEILHCCCVELMQVISLVIDHDSRKLIELILPSIHALIQFHQTTQCMILFYI